MINHPLQVFPSRAFCFLCSALLSRSQLKSDSCRMTCVAGRSNKQTQVGPIQATSKWRICPFLPLTVERQRLCPHHHMLLLLQLTKTLHSSQWVVLVSQILFCFGWVPALVSSHWYIFLSNWFECMCVLEYGLRPWTSNRCSGQEW